MKSNLLMHQYYHQFRWDFCLNEQMQANNHSLDMMLFQQLLFFKIDLVSVKLNII